MKDLNYDEIQIKDWTYCFTWKYPFIKKRKLTSLELLERKFLMVFNLLPIIYVIKGMYWVKSKLKL